MDDSLFVSPCGQVVRYIARASDEAKRPHVIYRLEHGGGWYICAVATWEKFRKLAEEEVNNEPVPMDQTLDCRV